MLQTILLLRLQKHRHQHQTDGSYNQSISRTIASLLSYGTRIAQPIRRLTEVIDCSMSYGELMP
jgi:hypothetical protein